MPLKRHHKWMIGGVSGFLVLTIIANSLLIYVLYGQLQLSYNNLEDNIIELQADTQNKFNTLTENIIKTKTNVEAINNQLGSIYEEVDLLKATTSEDFSGVVENAIKSVVTIKTNIGQGTGFIVEERGYIITNAHVLEGGLKVYAITYDQKVLPAEFIGYNGEFDIALLKVEGIYEKLILGNSDEVQVGEKAIAIGNPLGLQFSVTEGIVSGVHRLGLNNIESYIQTDAALNPGNSGGPLIDKQGKVIGINNFKIGGGESLGFALESNYIKSVVNEISNELLNEMLI